MTQNTIYTASFVVPITSPPIVGGAIHVRDNRIVAVGPLTDIRTQAPDAALVDFGAAILLPPLVNAHTHLELTDFPLWRECQSSEIRPQESGKGFVDWILKIIQVKHAVALEQMQQSVRNGLNQLMRAGTGAVCDVLSIAALDAEYLDSPLLGWLCFELIGLDEGMGAVLPMMAADWLDAPPPVSLQRGLSPHAPYTVGPQALGKMTELARSRQVLMTMHTAESPEETAFLMESAGDIAEKLYPSVGWHKPVPPYAVSSGTYIDKYGALVPGALMVHGVQFDPDTIHKIAKTEASVVLCPRSNARLAVGRAPVESYLCQEVNLALGTDSLSSNESLSLWDEMEFAREFFSPALSPAQLLAMATVNGARALRLERQIGALEAGWGANFQVLRPKALPEPEMIADFLCRGARGEEVAHLYLSGNDVLAKAWTTEVTELA